MPWETSHRKRRKGNQIQCPTQRGVLYALLLNVLISLTVLAVCFSKAFQSGVFLKTLDYVDRRKRRFSNSMMSYIIAHAPSARDAKSIALAFSRGRVKTIRICYVWTRVYLFIYFLKKEKKISVFPDPLVLGLISVQMAVTL